jgi:hypothetical protein
LNGWFIDYFHVWASRREGVDAFDEWMGRAVLIVVAIEGFNFTVRGLLLNHGPETLRVRSEGGDDLEIFKAMVLSIEEGRCCNSCHTSIGSHRLLPLI